MNLYRSLKHSETQEMGGVTGRKVLVIGDDTRSFLVIVRSLGRRGITVHAAPTNFRSPALRSRYISAIHYLPPWTGDNAGWLSAIEGLLRAEHYDLVIPCNETAILPLQRHRAALSQFAVLAVPDDRAIELLFDKHETRELARRVGVRVARGRLVRLDDTAERVLAEFGAPVVVKPRRSYSLQSLGARAEVQVVADATRLRQLLSKSAPDEALLEQYCAGRGIGISVLASSGRILQAFEHHRVREFAGASFYRRSAPLTPDLAGACEAIVANLKYTGIAMFEFKLGPTGDWVLLEVNARPWGSMPLPVALGVDFPYRWWRLLTAGEETPAVPYRIGVYGRNLMPDLGILRLEAGARRLGPMTTVGFMIGHIAELSRIPTGREVNDVLVRDDPYPGLIELAETARAISWRIKGLLPGAAAGRCRHARAQVEALRRTAIEPRIIFICQGNICRSPFAAALLRARLCDRRISIGSAGTLPQPGRATPILGVEAAAEYGVDLSSHRSVWLTRQAVDTASMLIVVDEITRSAVFDRYPDLRPPVIMLGDLTGIGGIPDPINGGAAQFRRVYKNIAAAIAELAGLITNQPLLERGDHSRRLKADPCGAVNSAATPTRQGDPGRQRLPRIIGRAVEPANSRRLLRKVLEYIRRLTHRVTSYLRSHQERHDFVEHPQLGQLLRKFRLHCRHVGLSVGIGKVVTGNDPRQEFDQPGTIDGAEKKVAVRFKALTFADPGKGKERGS